MHLSRKLIDTHPETASSLIKGRKNINIEMLLDDLRRVVNQSGGDTRILTYRKEGMFSSNTIIKHFAGSWSKAVSAAVTEMSVTIEDPIIRKKKPQEDNGKTKLRLCLGNNCNKTFMSWGPENRICGRCKKSDGYLNPTDEVHHFSGRSGGVSDIGGY